MIETITKKDLEEILDKKFVAYQGAIIEAVDFKFQNVEFKFQKVEKEMSELRSEIRQLAVTLDNFVKMMSDYKEEFTILKGEVDRIKQFIKEKFNFEIANQA